MSHLRASVEPKEGARAVQDHKVILDAGLLTLLPVCQDGMLCHGHQLLHRKVDLVAVAHEGDVVNIDACLRVDRIGLVGL